MFIVVDALPRRARCRVSWYSGDDNRDDDGGVIGMAY
jgi:hypothetical protein